MLFNIKTESDSNIVEMVAKENQQQRNMILQEIKALRKCAFWTINSQTSGFNNSSSVSLNELYN